MTAVAVRRVVLVTCAAGIAGMIVSSIRDSTGAALTFGLVTATAVLCALVATAVTHSHATSDQPVDDLGRRVESGVAALVEAGVDEALARDVVSDAVRLGRAMR